MSEPVNVFEFEGLAEARVELAAWEYIRGGAEDEVTLRENRAAFERILLRPRVLVDVSKRDLTTTVLGTRIPLPLMLAPTAYQRLSHPEGEVETARGAGALGVPMILSTLATRTMEDVAAAATGPLWFQLYMMDDMRVNEWLVRRAEENGYRAIVFTVDLGVTGNRERERRARFELPPDMPLQSLMARMASTPDSILEAEKFGQIPWKQDLTWRDVEWLKRTTELPIVIKGVLTAEDARLAVEAGAAGIMVSNHGGRQLDTSPATIEVLPEIVEAMGNRVEIYLDGGVRRGTDIVKAVALGARAVCIGRPYLWGLAANGAAGVQRVIEILRNEFDMALILLGRRSVAELDGSVIWRK